MINFHDNYKRVNNAPRPPGAPNPSFICCSQLVPNSPAIVPMTGTALVAVLEPTTHVAPSAHSVRPPYMFNTLSPTTSTLLFEKNLAAVTALQSIILPLVITLSVALI